MDIKNLLGLRRKIKARKPDFIRHDFHKKSGLNKKWRRPKGLHSKLRLNIRGKAKPISQGYRSPKKIRGMHKSGLEIKVVLSQKDVETSDPQKHALVFSSSLGKKKRIFILKKANNLNFNILNIENPEGYIKKIQEEIDQKKKEKNDEKKAVKEKSEKKEKKLSDKISGEEKKDVEKKEKDKLLTQRER